MFYKFSIKRTRTVPKQFDAGGVIHKWDEEQVAFTPDAIFLSLGKAKDYAQKHTDLQLEHLWEDRLHDWGHCTATVGMLEFYIIADQLGQFEPTEPMELPTDFYTPGNSGD